MGNLGAHHCSSGPFSGVSEWIPPSLNYVVPIRPDPCAPKIAWVMDVWKIFFAQLKNFSPHKKTRRSVKTQYFCKHPIFPSSNFKLEVCFILHFSIDPPNHPPYHPPEKVVLSSNFYLNLNPNLKLNLNLNPNLNPNLHPNLNLNLN